jgi:hypothetical protein
VYVILVWLGGSRLPWQVTVAVFIFVASWPFWAAISRFIDVVIRRINGPPRLEPDDTDR